MHSLERPLLAFAGSTRHDSWSGKLLDLAVDQARSLRVQVERIDLRDFPLPIFDADLEKEEGVPLPARQLRTLMQRSAGFIVASPEYNGALPPLVKNVLDWASRPGPGEDEKLPFRGKPAAIMSASPGGFGGFRGLMNLASILNSLGMVVLPDYVIIGSAPQAFGSDGGLLQKRQRDALALLVSKQVAMAATLPQANQLAAKLQQQLQALHEKALTA